MRFVEAAKRFWALYWAEMLYSGVLNQDAAGEVLSAAALIRSAGLSNDKFEWCMEKIEFAIEELA